MTNKITDWQLYFGCTAYFTRDGWMTIISACKAYKMPHPVSEHLPPHMILGERDEDLIISWDGLQCHTFPKRFTRIQSVFAIEAEGEIGIDRE